MQVDHQIAFDWAKDNLAVITVYSAINPPPRSHKFSTEKSVPRIDAFPRGIKGVSRGVSQKIECPARMMFREQFQSRRSSLWRRAEAVLLHHE